jgi:antitoxin component YwqK of YwqJK toxin-antitoxin module
VWEQSGREDPVHPLTSAETPPVKFPEIVKIDLGDPETQKIIAEAIDFKNLQNRGEAAEELEYVLYQKKPYSGWAKEMWDNGQIYALSQYKDGKKDGLETHWYRNGQKQWDAGSGEVLDDPETLDKIIAEAIDYEKLQRRQSEEAIAYDTRRGWGFGTLAYAPNKQTPYSRWGKTMYYNRQIRMLSQFKDGRQTGLSRTWYENGQKESERTYKDGKVMTIVVWK